MPRFLVVNTDKSGEEYPWLCDEVIQAEDGNVELWRAGKHIITLGPEDYAGGLVKAPWEADMDFEGSLEEYITQLDDDDIEITYHTVH